MITRVVYVNNIKGAMEDILKKLDNGMDDVADTILTRSQELVPVDEATLKKSGHVDREYLNKKIEYDAVHAAWIEYGTRPHPVSQKGIENITRWAKRVLGLSEKEAKQAAWLIALKIRHYGTEPQPFMRPAMDETIPKIPEIVQKRMK